MSWAESWSLAMELAADPASRVAASIAGWASPVSREQAVAMDLFDLTARIAVGDKAEPYPRAWDAKAEPKAQLPQASIRAALEALGHGRDDG